MRRVWWSVGMLLMIVALCTCCVVRVNRVCQSTEELLRQAEICMHLGDTQGARDSVYYARLKWNAHEGLMGLSLRHTETDDVAQMFPAITESIRHKDETEFYMRNAELIGTIKELRRMEIPYYFNVF